MDFMNFVKAVYKAATPSVDYDKVECIIRDVREDVQDVF